jgi:hypothetical protein
VHARREVRDVLLAERGIDRVPADSFTNRQVGRVAHARFDAVLHHIRKFVPVTCKKLDPVVRHGIVRRGDHHSGSEAMPFGEVRNTGRGEHAGRDDVGPCRHDARSERCLQHFSREARIARDEDARATGTAEFEGCRAPQREGEFWGQVAVSYSANTVGAEQTQK